MHLIGPALVGLILLFALYDYLVCWFRCRKTRRAQEDVEWVRSCCGSCVKLDLGRGN